MKGFGLLVFGVCAVVGVLSLVSYKQSDGMRKFAFSVLMFAAIATPLVSMVRNFDLGEELPDTGYGKYGELYAEVAEEAFRDGLLRDVCSRFGIPAGAAELSLYGFDFEKMSAERVRITLFGAAVTADTRAIKEYIEGFGIGECEVRIRLE